MLYFMRSLSNSAKRLIGRLLFVGCLFNINNACGFGLKDTFKNLHVNTTNPGNYQDAAAGYYSGGSSVIRTKNTAFNPISMSAPSLNTGCGGIDAFMGSVSMITGGEIVTLVENLGSQAPIYGLHLGMKTYAPQIEQVLKDLRNMQMQLNQFGIGHCKVTQAAFAAALPRNSAMYETVCNEMAAVGGSDLGEQRKACNNNQKLKAAAVKKQKIDPDALIDNYNIFIKAAKAVGVPIDMYETLMSMTGTIIVKNGVAIPYPSLANEKNSWNIHIKGGSGGSMYRCNNADCLDISINNNVTISEENSYSGQVRNGLNDLKIKMLSQQEEFTASDKGFIDSIGHAFPIYDHITLEASTGISILSSDSELIARYSFLEHIKKTTSDIKKGTYYIRGKQISDDVMKDYEKSLVKLLFFAEKEWSHVMSDADRINDRAEKIEKHVMARERG